MTYTSNRPLLEEPIFSRFGHVSVYHGLNTIWAIFVEIPPIHDKPPPEKVFDKLCSWLTETAIILQDNAKSIYLSYDYGPFLVELDCPFDI